MIPYEIDTNFSGVHKVVTYIQDNFLLEKGRKKYFKLKVMMFRVTTVSMVSIGQWPGITLHVFSSNIKK